MDKMQVTLKAGQTLRVNFIPYGPYTLTDLVLGDYNGYPLVTGKVVEGSETSRLFQFSKTRSIAGQTRTVYGITQAELDRGECQRTAM